MIPNNIAVLYALPDMTDDQKIVVESIIANKLNDTQEILLALGRHWKIKVWFKEPVRVNTTRHWIAGEESGTRYYKTANVGTVHVFNGFYSGGTYPLCYSIRKNGRNGYIFPDKSQDLNLIAKYEVLTNTELKEFDSYETFKAKFDKSFITEAAIQNLWNSTSAQHGDRYAPSDFKPLPKEAKEALARFIVNFTGIRQDIYKNPELFPPFSIVTNTDTSKYTKRTYEGDERRYYYFTARGYTNKRDLRISHTIIKLPKLLPISVDACVRYCSEVKGGGFNRNGWIVNKNTFLHLEDD